MTPSETERLFGRVCKQDFDKTKSVDWWTPVVLTKNNLDLSNLQIPMHDALRIFTIFEERRLILPIVMASNETIFLAYKINYK
jgi:hypothetical protein